MTCYKDVPHECRCEVCGETMLDAMPELDRKLIAALLDMTSQQYANHGCNDFDLHKHMTPEQAAELQKALADWTGETHSGQYSHDWLLMAYFANKVLTTE